jgi:hypothetical protein
VRPAETSGSSCNKESLLLKVDYGTARDLDVCLSNKSIALSITKRYLTDNLISRGCKIKGTLHSILM